MKEMNEKIQEKLWAEASAFVDKSSRKHLAHFGVTLEGSDNQYLELSFTCPCDDEDFEYSYDGDDIYEEMTIIEGVIEEKLGGELE